ncbi:acyl-CoA dehydrogenase family protein [Aestuariicella sp. G3-2]|uniref:acyl-CoA dehydrogenase family protein n=1 Tax=Pseudomaricurvus albidus TaxID=2842452 RepID=UPI001C0DAC22|nr:acyl-CoA dehydrogenase family protein [Aestuariicella albida]MBU3069519.1 acyl-CoA dehydrogenase family protein [Aestuariicella albida]
MAIPRFSPLSVQPAPGLSDEINDIRQRTADILVQHVIPNEGLLLSRDDPERRNALVQELQQHVRQCGLWAPHLPKAYGGMGVGFLGHAFMNEIIAWSPVASRIFGVVAPNAGNESLLVKYGTEEQKKRWLEPLVAGELQSCFSMTEPDNPGSDPRALTTTAVRDGDEWVINGRKWFTSNGRAADFAIVMCRTEGDGRGDASSSRMTQIIVPTNTPGFCVERNIPVWGHTTGDHVEITYKNVRVPIENQLGNRGSGHAAAQDRLGAGRVYHSMNCVGHMWRSFDLMVKRMTERKVHGGLLESKQMMQDFVAESYMDIQTARLLTIRCAEKIDAGEDARTDISAVKVYVPRVLHQVVDRAIQVYGGIGLSSDLPLASFYLAARTLRLADGPDEVHKILIAKNILSHYHRGGTVDFAA